MSRLMCFLRVIRIRRRREVALAGGASGMESSGADGFEFYGEGRPVRETS